MPAEEVELAPPRLQAPASPAEIFSDDRHDRLCHALGAAYRDVVRGFRGEFPHPPDLVARPGDEAELEAVLSYCEEAGAKDGSGGTSTRVRSTDEEASNEQVAFAYLMRGIHW